MRWVSVPSQVALNSPGARKGDGGAPAGTRSATSRALRTSLAPLDSTVSFSPGAGVSSMSANGGGAGAARNRIAKPQAAKSRTTNPINVRRINRSYSRAAAAVAGPLVIALDALGTWLIVL